MSEKKNLEISAELYDAIQQLKQIFAEMSGKPIENDEDVLSILVSGFIDSVMHEQKEGEEEEGEDEHGHHGHHHHHHKDEKGCCGNDKCENEHCKC